MVSIGFDMAFFISFFMIYDFRHYFMLTNYFQYLGFTLVSTSYFISQV